LSLFVLSGCTAIEEDNRGYESQTGNVLEGEETSSMSDEPCGATVEDFMRIVAGMPMSEVNDILQASPNRDLGSGTYILEYVIDDFTVAYLEHDNDPKVISIAVEDRSGNVLYQDSIFYTLFAGLLDDNES